LTPISREIAKLPPIYFSNLSRAVCPPGFSGLRFGQRACTGQPPLSSCIKDRALPATRPSSLQSFASRVQNWPPKGIFPILAGGSRSRGAQTGRLPHESRSLSTAHLLRPTAQPGSGWLTHSSRYSSNSSGPKTEMENAHVEIPTSNPLLLQVTIVSEVGLPWRSQSVGRLSLAAAHPLFTSGTRVDDGISLVSLRISQVMDKYISPGHKSWPPRISQAIFAHMSPGQHTLTSLGDIRGQSRLLACDVPAEGLGHRSQKQLSVFT
jgi:hypothetical protein